MCLHGNPDNLVQTPFAGRLPGIVFQWILPGQIKNWIIKWRNKLIKCCLFFMKANQTQTVCSKCAYLSIKKPSLCEHKHCFWQQTRVRFSFQADTKCENWLLCLYLASHWTKKTYLTPLLSILIFSTSHQFCMLCIFCNFSPELQSTLMSFNV